MYHFETILKFYLNIHSDDQTQCPIIIECSKNCQSSMLALGVNVRDNDDPTSKRDREQFPNIPFDDIEFSKHGFSRHVVHLVKEIACNYKLYVHSIIKTKKHKHTKNNKKLFNVFNK